MIIRSYKPADCAALAELFYNTVHTVNRGDYSDAQLHAWAPGLPDLNAWNTSFLQHDTVVAEIGDSIVGFGDIDKDGYLDRLYVHRDYQRQGIASAICSALEQAVSPRTITTQASITARAFFEKRGYRVLKEQQVQRRGLCLTNYLMQR